MTTIHLTLTPAQAREVQRARLQQAIRRVQKQMARLQDRHEQLVNELAAMEKQPCTTL